MTGFDQDSPPSVERFTITPAPLVLDMGREATSQTPWAASNATAGSLTRSKLPLAKTVVPGRNPCVHEPPASVDVAHPMSEEPPSKKRPLWKAATIVDPYAKVSGSTCASCCELVFVNESVLICVGLVVACAVAGAISHPSASAAAITPAIQGVRRALRPDGRASTPPVNARLPSTRTTWPAAFRCRSGRRPPSRRLQ